MYIKGYYIDTDSVKHKFNIEYITKFYERIFILEQNGNIISAYLAPVSFDYFVNLDKYEYNQNEKILLFDNAVKVSIDDVSNFIIELECQYLYITKIRNSLLYAKDHSQVAIDLLMASSLYYSNNARFIYNRQYGNCNLIKYNFKEPVTIN